MPPTIDSYGARTHMAVAEGHVHVYRLDALERGGCGSRFAAAVLAEDPAREPAAARGRPRRSRRTTSRRWRRGTRRRAPEPRDAVPAGARADAGLHRRAVRRRPGGDARRDPDAGRRPEPHQPAAAGGPRDRPLGAGGPVRVERRVRRSTRARSSSATASATSSCAGGRRRSTNFRVVPPDTGIVHQVNLEYLAPVVVRALGRTAHGGVPGHARRHGLAHDDDQRARRAGLGRRRHRGGGGDAGPADVDADAGGRRLQAHGPAAAKARRRPTSCSW